MSLHELELKISHLLRAGVLFAGMLLLVGWLWMWAQGGDVLGSYSEYKPQSLSESIQWALIMNDRALLLSFAGLGVLVTLPLVRVLMTGILFVKQKDYRLAIMAFAVFIALVASFFLGIEI